MWICIIALHAPFGAKVQVLQPAPVAHLSTTRRTQPHHSPAQQPRRYRTGHQVERRFVHSIPQRRKGRRHRGVWTLVQPSRRHEQSRHGRLRVVFSFSRSSRVDYCGRYADVPPGGYETGLFGTPDDYTLQLPRAGWDYGGLQKATYHILPRPTYFWYISTVGESSFCT